VGKPYTDACHPFRDCLLTEMVKIHLDIRDPSMTFLHRAGVAGLFVQLKYLEYRKLQPPHGLNWSLTAQAIELDWTGKDLDALQWLFSQSFQIDSDGLIYFPAIEHSMDFRQRLAIHRGLQNSFLQHHQFFKSAGKVVREEGDREIEYRACASYVHQKATDFICDRHGNLQSKPIKITGWIYPGATVQHELVKATTQFSESLPYFLALLFAPLACAHVSISSNWQQQKVQNGIIIPEVINLEKCDRQSFHYWANGWSDAALKFLLKTTAINQRSQAEIHRCLVIPFGKVTWSKQQQTRLAAETIEIETQRLDLYQTFCAESRQDDPLSQFIAQNLIRGKPWWWEFADVFIHQKAYLAIKFRQDRIHDMVKKTEWDTESQELFVRACHQGLRITFGKIGGKTKEGDYPQFERKVIQLRSNLERCHSAAAFRDFITSFWGNAGNIKVLQDSWQKLLPLTTGQSDWKMAKSLFFLALASYKGEEKPPDPDRPLVEDPLTAITEPEVRHV
jgi:CRISPR-associated protein Cas8a1/Csx13